MKHKSHHTFFRIIPLSDNSSTELNANTNLLNPVFPFVDIIVYEQHFGSPTRLPGT
jgi:hypothetical protein